MSSPEWLILGIGLAITVAITGAEMHRLTLSLRTGKGSQYEQHEVGQSLPANIAGFLMELALIGALIFAPSVWQPMILAQFGRALFELAAGEPGINSLWSAGKLIGGLVLIIMLKFHVGNFKHPH